jgi:glutamine synthetase
VQPRIDRRTHARFVESKRAEWDDYRTQLTPWEMERYLPVL